MLTLRDKTDDVTYCADVTCFLHATSGGLSLTVAFFLCRFFVFYCFKCDLASFSRCKTAFSPNSMPHKHVEQIDAKWLEKFSDVNKSIKETKLFCWRKIEFYFTHEHQKLYFHSWLPPLVKILRWYSFGEITGVLNLATLCEQLVLNMFVGKQIVTLVNPLVFQFAVGIK